MSKSQYQRWLWNKVVDEYYKELNANIVTEVA